MNLEKNKINKKLLDQIISFIMETPWYQEANFETLLKEIGLDSNQVFKKYSNIKLNKHLENIDNIIKSINLNKKEAIDKINKIFGIITFKNNHNKIQQATLDDLYNLSIYTHYIKKKWLEKNKQFNFLSKYGKLKITINNAKPEIMFSKNKTLSKTSDPKCVICYENVGWSGNNEKESKENLRTKNINLIEEPWFIQFSPYQYFYNHLILVNKRHTHMKIDENIIYRMNDFLSLYPDYFIGSNAGRKWMGGSILEHDHYQGGKDHLPIMNAKEKTIKEIYSVQISEVKWPIKTIKLCSTNVKNLSKVFNRIKNSWEKYISPENKNKKNNAVSVLSKKEKQKIIVWIFFRNNFEDTQNNLPIRYASKKYWIIKKEAIGIIEAAGLAILPDRLIKELEEVINRKTNNMEYINWLQEFNIDYTNKNLNWKSLNNIIGKTFEKILEENNPFTFSHDFTKFFNSIKF